MTPRPLVLLLLALAPVASAHADPVARAKAIAGKSTAFSRKARSMAGTATSMGIRPDLGSPRAEEQRGDRGAHTQSIVYGDHARESATLTAVDAPALDGRPFAQVFSTHTVARSDAYRGTHSDVASVAISGKRFDGYVTHESANEHGRNIDYQYRSEHALLGKLLSVRGVTEIGVQRGLKDVVQSAEVKRNLRWLSFAGVPILPLGRNFDRTMLDHLTK